MTETILDRTEALYTSYDQLPLTLSAPQAANAIGCSVSKMYELMHSADFPTTIINKRLMVRKEMLIKYMNAHTRNFAYWDQYEIREDRHS